MTPPAAANREHQPHQATEDPSLGAEGSRQEADDRRRDTTSQRQDAEHPHRAAENAPQEEQRNHAEVQRAYAGAQTAYAEALRALVLGGHAPMDLSRSVVAVTCAARGIGLATAEAFAAAGATVHTGDLDTLDVTSRESFANFVDNVLVDSGRIDILINNAGVMPLGPFLDEPDEISRTTLDVNLWGPIHGMRLVLPHMLAQGNGHIVNIASMAGKIPFPGMAVYSASKYATIGLTAAVRRELEDTGVTISAVLPSAVRTSLSSGVRLGGLLPTVNPQT